MRPSDEIEGVDFRPFFDMVVGILFVLLILIGAMVFFQRAEGETAEALPDHRRWRWEHDRFLDRLAADLAAQGLPARADTAAGAVLVRLDEIVRLDGPGLPGLQEPAAASLAGALSPAVGCVSVPRASGRSCADTDLLSLDSLHVQVRLGTISGNAALPRDRAARFIAAIVSNSLYTQAPSLLRASDRAGAPAIGVEDGTVGDGTDGGPGDLALVFGFAKPGP